MAIKKSYSRSNKTGFPPFLFLLFLATTLPLQSLENIYTPMKQIIIFFAKLLKKKQSNCKSYYGYLMLITLLMLMKQFNGDNDR